MEQSFASAPRRPLIGRLLRWLTATGLLAGGGWGAVQWHGSAPVEPPTKGVVSAKTQHDIHQLFGSTPADEPEKALATTPDAELQRYAATPPAPELPPLAEPTEAEAKPASVVSPEDRYAPWPAPTGLDGADESPPDEAAVETTEDSVGTIAETPPAEQPPVADEPDVARGQEPEASNPLRQGALAAENQDAQADEARAAFAAAFSKTRNTAEPAIADDHDPGFDQAQPLPRATPDYRGQQPATAPPAATPPTTGGAAPYRIEVAEPPAATLAEQEQPASTRPAPPLSIATSASSTSPTPADAASPPPGAAAPDPSVTPTPGLQEVVGAGRPGERGLEGPQSPAIMIQKLAPTEIQVGKKCTFAVRVKNNGQRAAQQVVIEDEVPLGTQLAGTAPRASVSGSQVRWDLGTLSVGEERVVEMELIPTDEGDLGSVAVVTFAAEASARARCTRPELQLRLTCEPRVMVGSQHLVRIEISNPGSGDATGVMLLESLPSGVSHEAGTALEFEVGTLRAGETRTLDLVLTAEQAGVVENVMTARADASLQTTASCEFEVIAPALAISLEGPKRKYLERPAKFVVNLDNPGTASAKDVQLVAQLPKGLKYVKANNMGEYDQATHSVYWSLAELPANQRGTVELTALPVAAGEHTIRAATKAEQGLEDRAESSLQVEGMAALSFETQALENLIELGGETTCEIRVTNRGSKSASNVQVSAVMPGGLRAVSAKGDTQHSLQGNQVAFTPLLQLAPGAEAVYFVTCQGVAPGDQLVKVRVTSDDQQPITKEASARVYADQ